MTLSAPTIPSVEGLLDITAVHDGTCIVLVLTGEVCVATAPILRLAIEGAVEAGTPDVVVDLSATTLFTAAGVTVLVRTQHLLRAAGGSVRVTGASPFIERTFTVCGVCDLLERPGERGLATMRCGAGAPPLAGDRRRRVEAGDRRPVVQPGRGLGGSV